MADTSHLSPAVRELAEAIRLTREYVGEELLPPIEGWSWYDALRRWAPEYLPQVPPPVPTEMPAVGSEYPRPDGEFTILGPETFTNADRTVICHKGEMYDAKVDSLGETSTSMSNLVDHARRELALIGEEEWPTNGLLKVITAFAEMGHSGFSAEHCTVVLEKLLRYRPLSPITDDPAEWEDRSEMSGYLIWQNVRDSRAMSSDGGKTYTLVDEDPVTSDSGQPVHTSQPKAG